MHDTHTNIFAQVFNFSILGGIVPIWMKKTPVSQNEDVGVSQIQADRWEWSKFLQETALWCNGHPNLGRHKFGTTQTWARDV